MITRLSGVLIEKTPGMVVVDVQGVGYELWVSMQTYYRLPDINQNIILHTQMIVRDDAHWLIGFDSKEERTAFNLVQKVSGIGVKTALNLLSTLSSDELAQVLVTADVTRLTKVPGIGKKTAERIMLELGGKLLPVSENVAINHGIKNDIIAALMALGYSEKIATQAVRLLDDTIELNAGIKQALKQLSQS